MSGIIGLDLQASTHDMQCQYIHLFNTKHASTVYLNPLLQQSSSFISLTSEQDYFSGMTEQTQKEHQAHLLRFCERVFFLNKLRAKKPPNIQNAINDLTCITLPKKSILYISIPERYCHSAKKNNLQSFFKQTSNWAKDSQICINFIIYGNQVNSMLKPKLIGLSQYLSGLTSLHQIDDKEYDYHIAFWCNHHGVIANHRYVITLDENNDFTVTQNESQPDQTNTRYADEERIYVASTALDKKVAIRESVIVINNNDELFTFINTVQIQASTIVLSYHQTSELESLALHCYLLRRTKGNAIKIIIRETAPSLRYIDEKLLLNAGVNLIIPFSVSFSRCVSLVEALQGQIFTRNIPQSTTDLLKINQDFDQIGYLPNPAFKDYCLKLMSIVEQKSIRFALIKLTLISTMKAIDCLHLCHINRFGDIVTVCDHALYVLFSAIRLNDVHSTLNQLFDIPIESLFLSYFIIDNANDLETELAVIINRAEIIQITEKVTYISKSINSKAKASRTLSINKPLNIIK
ncbi:cellulose biosynthesis protein BcsE [Shewanella surugensis]|uniref:Cellulose biosynthesis protein BcsE n=1 Tax=Shewanella surugensis TaxID=212020 RepID=A0ABT0L902_9GAMM|nr:cellulose biosynthesis protein BcsE [Shewanella surugensis]MCL1123636.1 cellulose biosynthesis protein BcsE [Shewanella surugensis]